MLRFPQSTGKTHQPIKISRLQNYYTSILPANIVTTEKANQPINQSINHHYNNATPAIIIIVQESSILYPRALFWKMHYRDWMIY